MSASTTGGKPRLADQADACSPNTALEDRVDMLGVVAVVEQLLELGVRSGALADHRVGLQEVEEPAFAAPDLHRVALHGGIGVLARSRPSGSGPASPAASGPGRPGGPGSSACSRDRCCSRSITPARRRRAKSRWMVASGPMPRSTDEWLMSRSCQRATFSSAGTTAERTRRARPVRFSVSTGLRLCGMADEPFWPGSNGSSASSTSVRCRWRISVARRSTEEATTARAAKIGGVAVARDHLGRDRLDLQAHLVGDVGFDARVDVGEGADRAGDGAGGDLEPGHGQPLLGALELGVVAGQLQAEGGRLGVDAVAAADGRRSACVPGPGASGRPAPGRRLRSAGRWRWLSCTARQVSSTSRLVMPWCRKRASGPTISDTWVRKAMTSCLVTRSISSMRSAVPDRVAALVPDRLGGELGDDPQLGHGVGGVGLDLEPDLVAWSRLDQMAAASGRE